ncbi:hypothetical protein Dsin_014645 [Dipteronia sinensis]|uniref:Neprosin PEP catalytic domain-containing protein n=1 Tax=Dipteronia sinensis TaxID=43782 RepID=A0AAE0EBS1_9ROSI|nr:hypothetical protein Dsin_014645 [Dipteronia sinensis]
MLEGGEIIDCIDFYKQPGFDHPLLKNHTIQSVYVSMERYVGEKFHGLRGIFSLYNISIGVRQDQSSTTNVWVQGGPTEHKNYITAGSMIAPGFYGDGSPRLFIYWTADGGYSTGCYNLRCPGFVQVHHEITPGRILSPLSQYGGPTYDLKVIVNQDKNSKNWVLTAFQEEIVVGYLPSELLPSLKDGAEVIAWGGNARTGNNGVTPPMGSGFRPLGGDRRYDCNCFSLVSSNTEPRRENFLFGGPGGSCGN